MQVTDFGNGTALASYTPRIAGECLLSVLLGVGGAAPAHISGSPFSVLVAEGPLEGDQSEAFGEGLREAVAGQVAEFTVQARDAFGNVRSDAARGSGEFTDGARDYALGPARVDQGDDDTFNVTLVCRYS